MCLHIFQVSLSASFANDLKLDSLDAVEVVMAIEEVRVVSSSTSIFLYLSSTGVRYRDSGRRS